MNIAIAGDSAGKPLAELLFHFLETKRSIKVVSLSDIDASSTEYYANMAERVCAKIISERYDRAILVSETGIGVNIAANKVPGIRAALTHDTYSAAKAATSNNAQVITLGARVIGVEVAKNIVNTWIESVFDPVGASADNVIAIDGIEIKYKPWVSF